MPINNLGKSIDQMVAQAAKPRLINNYDTINTGGDVLWKHGKLNDGNYFLYSSAGPDLTTFKGDMSSHIKGYNEAEDPDDYWAKNMEASVLKRYKPEDKYFADLMAEMED